MTEEKLDLREIIHELWGEIKRKGDDIRRRDKVLLGLALYCISGELPTWLI